LERRSPLRRQLPGSRQGGDLIHGTVKVMPGDLVMAVSKRSLLHIGKATSGRPSEAVGDGVRREVETDHFRAVVNEYATPTATSIIPCLVQTRAPSPLPVTLPWPAISR
jgi:hypothetical protein